jgi:4-hydroxythreonine-4-phosphate dehydrogenase
MSQLKTAIALTLGDPAGIGPEIILKSLADAGLCDSARIVLTASAAVLRETAERLGLPLELSPDRPDAAALRAGAGAAWSARLGAARFGLLEPGHRLAENLAARGLAFPPEVAEAAWAIQDGRSSLAPGTVGAGSGFLAFLYIALAAALCQDPDGGCRSMVTAPIHKEALRAAAVPFIGHTEILGGLAGVDDPLTMFQTGTLRIFFHSRHVSLRRACELVTADRVLASIRRCDRAMRELGLGSRRLAVAGLNPHCGEHGLFGDEDDAGVAPAVAAARAEGIDVAGPVGADSVFHQALHGRYDAVLSLYHDQGHVASKTLDFDRTIAVTLGLPYLRASVDHGTAMDIAGKGIARETSMKEALAVAIGYAR